MKGRGLDRFWPRSLRARLVAGAALLVVGTLLVTVLVTGLVLRHFIRGQVDSRLDTQLRTVASALVPGGPDGLALSRNVDGPPFDRRATGWFWQVLDGDRVVLRSASLDEAQLPPPPLPDPDAPPPHGKLKHPVPPELAGPPRAAELAGPLGEPLRIRIAETRVGLLEATVMAAAPLRALTGPLRDVLTSLILPLGLLGAGLLGAVLVQVRIGLDPLRRLQAQLAAVREGRLDRIRGRQPAEIGPIVGELNSLLDQNAANLDRARKHVANLAHGLKTPLATLAVQLAEPGRDPDGGLERLVLLMDRRIRHHLGRARAAALGGPVRSRTLLAPRVADLAIALPRIYAGRQLGCEIDVAADLALACDPQDCDEMLGNILDNAFKWARSRIRISARGDGKTAIVTVEDDGPGLPSAEAAAMLLPGRRLDEAAPGYGFGLPITRELAELYGGGVALGASTMGGLKVEIGLPQAEHAR